MADLLIPALKLGDTVAMDSLATHKVAGVRQVIGAVEARLLYLTPYSSDFGPIENASAELKALLRTAAVRTVPDLWAAVWDAFTRFRPDECRNYLAGIYPRVRVRRPAPSRAGCGATRACAA